MIKHTYFVYEVGERLIISDKELSYFGEKKARRDARLLAISDVANTDLSKLSTEEVKKYVADNLYSTPKWESYQLKLDWYSKQIDKLPVILQQKLEVTFNDDQIDFDSRTVINQLKNFLLDKENFRSGIIEKVSEISPLL